MHSDADTHNDNTDFANMQPTRRQWLPKAVILLLILFAIGLVRASPMDAVTTANASHVAGDR